MNKRPSFHRPLSFDRWPFIDQQAWRRALVDDDLACRGEGLGAHWRETTRQMVIRGYGVWLSWLLAKERLEPGVDPAARATRDRVREYLADMRWAGYSEFSCYTRLIALGAALRVMSPDIDTTFVTRAAGRVSARAAKGRDLSGPGRTAEDLLGLSERLMQVDHEEEPLRAESALAYRDGLLLALLVHRPIRISNLAAIQIGRHLVRGAAGFRLRFDAREMKGGKPYDCMVPRALSEPLDQYVRRIRPALMTAGVPSSALWIGSHGRPLIPASVTAAIRRRTRAAFGSAYGPHLVRHIVATTIAEHSPQDVADAAAILGHRHHGISERHYIHASAMHAGLVLQEALAGRLRRN